MGGGGGRGRLRGEKFVFILLLLPLTAANIRSAALGKMATIFMYGQVRLLKILLWRVIVMA
jgi:hypothetical protein